MTLAHKDIDRATLVIIATVAAIHLLALHPIALTHNDTTHEDAVDVVIELATPSPATAATVVPPSPRPPPPTRPSLRTSNDGDETAPLLTPSAPHMAVAESQILPITQASYEVGSTRNPRPPYPPAAFVARIEGRVIVKVHVMSDGKPAEVQLLQTSGSAALDKSALDTISRWELQPARKNGQAIDQWIEIPIHFRILQK
jgi:periplasmic protein TonB